MMGGAALRTHLVPSPGGDSFPNFNTAPKQNFKPGIIVFNRIFCLTHL